MSTHTSTFKRSLKETQKSFQNDTQMVKHEYMGMTQKPSNSHLTSTNSPLSAHPKTNLWKHKEHADYPSGYVV